MLAIKQLPRSPGSETSEEIDYFKAVFLLKTATKTRPSVRDHSRPQSLRSFWPVVGIESSGLVQHRKSVNHGLPVKSSKSDWLTMRNEYSAHAHAQSSRSQPQAKRIVGSGDENGRIFNLQAFRPTLRKDPGN